MDLAPMIAAIDAEHAAENPGARLERAAQTAADLRSIGDDLLDHYVRAAREAGCSWTDIGQWLGITKQGAQKRFGPSAIAAADPWPSAFSPAAQAVVADAARVARAMGHQYLGPEHVLIALCSPDAGLAAACLAGLGVTRSRVEAKVVERLGRTDVTPEAPLGVAPAAKRAFETARREAGRIGHRCPRPEHLLLALYADARGSAAAILGELGASEAQARTVLSNLLSGQAPELAARIRHPPRRRLTRR